MFISLKNIMKSQQGSLLLGLAVITVVVGGWLYLAGTTAQKIRETSGRALDELINDPENAPIEPALEHRQNVAKFAQVVGQTGNLVNTVATSVGPGQGADLSNTGRAALEGINQAKDQVISRQLEDDSPPPTSSNPLPPDVTQPPACSSTSMKACTNKTTCSSVGGTWQPNNTCTNTPVPTCRRSNLSSGCTSQTDCENNGGYWYNNRCNASPQCDSSHLNLCKTRNDCITHGGFWFDDQCNVSPPDCWTGEVVNCRTRLDCESALGYWYDGACHTESKCADGGGVVTCDNGQEICGVQVCDSKQDCSDGSDEATCDCSEETGGIFVCANGRKICRPKVCNNTDDCGDGSDEANCQDAQSCCVVTHGCPGETASSCADSCCCCPYGQVCDRVNFFNGCITVGAISGIENERMTSLSLTSLSVK